VKKNETHMSLRGNFSGPVSTTDQAKSSKDTASLVACTWKRIFWLWGADFLFEWHQKWRLLSHLGPLHLALARNC